MFRRGQAAMEFLMTYGWAILAAIIAIGVLAYFGVFSPGQYVGSSAVVTAPFYANAWNVDVSDGGVNLELQNNGGETLEVTDVSISASDGGTCTTSGYVGNVSSGSLQNVLVACSTLDAAGETFKGDVTVTYMKSGSTIELTSTGTVTDTIRA